MTAHREVFSLAALPRGGGWSVYRVKKLLENQGLKVYGSPRPWDRVPLEQVSWKQEWLYVRQALAYGLWRVGIPT